MPTPSREKSLFVLSALAAASFGSAQMTHRPEPPEVAAYKAVIEKTSRLTKQGWQYLRERKLGEAEMAANEAVRLYDEASYSELEGHDILAEVHLLQGEPGLALAEVKDKSPALDWSSAWTLYTKAIALAQLGRKAEARAILTDTAGEAGAKGGHETVLRSNLFHWRLPMDGDDSVKAIVATGYLLRSNFRRRQDRPEALEDLQTALTLSPQLPVAHWMLSQRLKDEGRFDEALVEAKLVGMLSNPKAAAFLASHVDSLQWQIEIRNKAKTGG